MTVDAHDIGEPQGGGAVDDEERNDKNSHLDNDRDDNDDLK